MDRVVDLHFLDGNIEGQPRAFGIARDLVGLSRRFPSLEIENQSDDQAGNADESSDTRYLSPLCADLGGISCLPLGTQVTLIVALGLLAWSSIIYGIMKLGKSDASGLFIIGGIAILLVPFLYGPI